MSAHTPGPWVSERAVCDAEGGHGLAVIAVIPEVEREGFTTPTRGMVAWIHSGLGACSSDDEAVATARLIAASPDMHAYIVKRAYVGDTEAQAIIDEISAGAAP